MEKKLWPRWVWRNVIVAVYVVAQVVAWHLLHDRVGVGQMLLLALLVSLVVFSILTMLICSQAGPELEKHWKVEPVWPPSGTASNLAIGFGPGLVMYVFPMCGIALVSEVPVMWGIWSAFWCGTVLLQCIALLRVEKPKWWWQVWI